MRKKGKKTAKNLVWSLLFLTALAVFCFSAWQLIQIFLNYKEGTDEYEELRQYTVETGMEAENTESGVENSDKTESAEAEQESSAEEETGDPKISEHAPISVDFSTLQKINPDVKGWLYLEALDISYPIVQGEDNEEYLHTTFEGNDNSAGSIFMDYANREDFSDCNTILYGHNMKNLSMFGKLKQIKEQEKYKKSCYFWILTPEKNALYQIYSAFYTEADSDVYTFYPESGDRFSSYVSQMAEKSEIPVEFPGIPGEQPVVTLSTCASRDSSGRFVVQGVRIAEQ